MDLWMPFKAIKALAVVAKADVSETAFVGTVSRNPLSQLAIVRIKNADRNTFFSMFFMVILV
jgi:hypothetical protein